MKFTVSSQSLKDTLTKVFGAIGNNPVLPILEDFLFTLDGRILSVTATDLEIFTTASLEVEQSTNSGIIAIPAKILLDTIKQLPTQPITLSVDSETYRVTITSAFGEYHLAGEDGRDYPKTPEVEEGNSIAIDSATIDEIINKTLFATSNDELRPAMTGVCFDLNYEQSNFVATDAHKLSKFPLMLDIDTSDRFIVPKRALNILKNTQSANSINISWSNANVVFDTGNQKIISRLIDARYPDYNAVFPKSSPNIMHVNRASVLKSLKRLANYANKTTNQVALTLSKDKLVITAEDLDFNQKASETQLCDYDGQDMTIGFNVKYLVEVLNALGSERVAFGLSTPNRAGVVTEVDGSNAKMLVMPVMIAR